MAALRKLPPRYGIALILYLHGLSPDEISSEMDLPSRAHVYVLRHRALKALRRELLALLGET